MEYENEIHSDSYRNDQFKRNLLFIPIHDALKTVHLGVTFNKNGKEMVESVFRNLNGKTKLSFLIYQHNRFERWGMRVNSNGKIGTCDFEELQ